MGIFSMTQETQTRALKQPRGVGWGGRREGGSRGRGHMGTYVWQKPTQFYKAIILQLKINKFKIKRIQSSH